MYYKHKSAEQQKELFAILDTESNSFWFSGMNRVAYSSSGIAKTAFSSSAKNPLRCKFGEQTRFKIVRVAITPDGIVAHEV
jgi:hypothetical protein